ncbi:MAG: DUF6438 domain-containing protein [Parasphingorhabdus sp.]|uniref:DUF6438 domain-containing protein n=1 Tax=Parasphingorhabdus sp. TaxID=2709688 RepID=UPI00329A5B0A
MMKYLLAVILLIFALGACTDRIEVDTLDGEYFEATPEKLSGKNFIRSGSAKSGHHQIAVTALVDENGRVIDTSTRPDKFGTKEIRREDPYRARAEIEAKKWKFEPYTQSGKPIKIKTTIYINVYPPEILPERHVPFPKVDYGKLEITLERTGCFGSCPGYIVQVFGDGKVKYKGGYYTLVEGEQTYSIPKKSVMQLVDDFRKADFWSLKDEYRYQVTDNPTYAITFKTGSHSKTIVDYVGLRSGMPFVVRELQDKIDEITKTERWLRGNSNTIPSLEKAGFDFGSKEGQRAFVAAAEFAPENIAISFLDKGVPLNGEWSEFPDCSDCGPNEEVYAHVLSVAVRLGRLELFKRIEKDSFLNQLTQEQKNRLLMGAAKSNSLYMVSQLVEIGADLKQDRSSPLIAALDNDFSPLSPDADKLGLVKFLLAAGVDLAAKDYIDYTALQHAHDENPKIVKWLLDAGADVNAGSIDELNAIENTSSSLLYITDDEDIAMMAIKAGADTTLKADQNRTLKELARRKSWNRVLNYIARKPE